MKLSAEVVSILNEQINKELYSAYLYVTFADYYESRGLAGFANWYMIQAKEEVDHGLGLRRYLIDNDEVPVMEAIAKPDKTFSDDLSPLKAALAHEELVTESIHNCYKVAHSKHDIRTMNFLDWYVEEQMEEEVNAREMVDNYENFGTTPEGLRALNAEYLERSYETPSTLAL